MSTKKAPPKDQNQTIGNSVSRLLGMGFDIFLVLLIVVGVGFRFSWVDWNQGTNLHPDEYGLTNTMTRLSFPESVSDYFNTRVSPLSPYQKYDIDGQPTEQGPDNRMRWGQLPITIIRWMAEQTDNVNYGDLRLLGRRLSALADTLSLLFIFLIGRRLYHYRVGLLAAALSGLAVMQIQQSHFMTADNFGVLFTSLAMFSAVQIAKKEKKGEQSDSLDSEKSFTLENLWAQIIQGDWKWYLLFGLTFGMAMATRINLFPLSGMILIANLVANSDGWESIRDNPLKLVVKVVLPIMLAGIISLITFRIAQPMTFRAETGDTSLFTLHFNPDWVDSMKVAQNESSGIGGGPPGEQWTDRLPIIFPLVNIILWGMGLPLGLTVWFGFAWAAYRTIKGSLERRAHMIPLIWVGGYFLFMGTRWVKSIRYFLPIYPFLCLFAAWAIIELWNRGTQQTTGKSDKQPSDGLSRFIPSPSAVGALLLGAFVTFGTLFWAWGFVNAVYRQDNNRIRASRWMFQNIPGPVNLHIETEAGLITEPLSAPFGRQISTDDPLVITFKPQVTGTASGLTIGHALNMNQDQSAVLLHVVLAADPEGLDSLAQADIRIEPDDSDPRGGEYSVPFGPGGLESGKTYYLIATVPEGGPVAIAGSTIANDSWDEGLPLRMDGRDPFGGLYRGLTMEVRWIDDENKLQMFLENLDQLDYIIMPSQRAVWSAPRIPLTYPMTMEYYRALFDGRLGFELADLFTSPIQFGPIFISDLGGRIAWGQPPELPLFNDNLFAAEEAFTVYDHAPVWIFRKRSDFNLNEVRAILESVDLDKVIVQGPRDATKELTTLMLPPERLADQRLGGTWSDLFNRDSLINRFDPIAIIVWWLLIGLLGLLALPLTRIAFPGLIDGGYPVARLVGLLLVAWGSWVLGSLGISVSRTTISLVILVLATGSIVLAWRDRDSLLDFVKQRKREILLTEVVALGFFALDLIIRFGNPDLWHPGYGGEKPMDFSYLNAVIKSETFPPYDPWFSGGYINYYYFGFVIVGMPIKLLGLMPSIAYNLVLPTLFSLLALSAYSVGYNLLARYRETHPEVKATIPRVAGLAAAIALVVLGNLGTARMFYEGFKTIGVSQGDVPGKNVEGVVQAVVGLGRYVTVKERMPYPLHQWYWNPSRAIMPGPGEVGPITEFPFFTFLYADLHAHMISRPYTVLAIGWCLSWLISADKGKKRKKKRKWQDIAMGLFLGGLILGSLRPTNTWDFPVYWLLGAIVMAYAVWIKRKDITLPSVAEMVLMAVLLIGLAQFLYQPYHQWYGQGYEKADQWEGSRTQLVDYLTVHGLFLFVITSWMAVEAVQWMAATPLSALQRLRPYLGVIAIGAAGVLGGSAYLFIEGYKIAILVIPLIAWSGVLLLRSNQPVEKRVVLSLVGIALAMTFLVEVVYLVGDMSRMNTVFKFYLQVWEIFSVTAAVSLAWILVGLPAWIPGLRRVWGLALGILVFFAALYPLTAGPAKMSDRMAKDVPLGLDGIAFMPYAERFELHDTFSLEEDYKAILWMQDNVEGSPVIVEANIPEYRWGSRFTIYTGLPGVLGWNNHQRQQRVSGPAGAVEARAADILSFYLTRSIDDAKDFLEKYEVQYVILGRVERTYFENMQPCSPTGDGVNVSCDIRGYPVGMPQPGVPITDCTPLDPQAENGSLICPTHGLEKFDAMVSLDQIAEVFRFGETVIYEVVE